MSRSFDPQKLAMWQGRLRRFSDSGLAVARFCARERVSVASFYHWRKRLGQQAPTRRASVRGDVFEPVTVVPALSGLSIMLPGGTQIQVRGEHLDTVRAVIAEVAHADLDSEVARVDRGQEP